MLFTLMMLSNISPAQKNNTYTIDFGKERDGMDWQIVDDGVMGGLSAGEGTLYDDYLQFQGYVSLENNGGFSSLRSPYKEMDLSPFTIVEIRYKSTDYNISFTLNKHREWYLPRYKTDLKPTNGKWAIMTIQLADIEEYVVGRATGSYMDKESLAQTIRMGFITNEKRADKFDFEVDYIKFH